MRTHFLEGFALAVGLVICMGAEDCNDIPGRIDRNAVAASGVRQATVEVPVQSNGLTTEQRNVTNRLKQDNQPGSIKHLYILSAYSGQVLLYSTVDGKVTSSGKRLHPVSQAFVATGDYGRYERYNPDLIQDDGTYGNSAEYVYWWDTKGVYYQHYIAGGEIFLISSQPLAVKQILINLAAEK